MDRKQMIVQRVREFFGERVDDVVHMVRQDRQEVRGWEEPAHLRAALRRAVRAEGGSPSPQTEAGTTTVYATEFGRTAGEPDRGQQREAMGQMLEAGANALEKVIRQAAQEITLEETLAL